jgi:ribosome biogenesis GTPase A
MSQHLPQNKRLMVGFAGYPNTGKSSILKLITDFVKGNLAKSAVLPNTREVSFIRLYNPS